MTIVAATKIVTINIAAVHIFNDACVRGNFLHNALLRIYLLILHIIGVTTEIDFVCLDYREAIQVIMASSN